MKLKENIGATCFEVFAPYPDKFWYVCLVATGVVDCKKKHDFEADKRTTPKKTRNRGRGLTYRNIVRKMRQAKSYNVDVCISKSDKYFVHPQVWPKPH